MIWDFMTIARADFAYHRKGIQHVMVIVKTMQNGMEL